MHMLAPCWTPAAQCRSPSRWWVPLASCSAAQPRLDVIVLSQQGPGGTAGLMEKRVANGRIKSELGVRLRYPTYREGLLAISRGSLDPF